MKWSLCIDGERTVVVEAPTASQARKLGLAMADSHVGKPRRVTTKKAKPGDAE